MAVERLKDCDNIVELSQELGVHRRLLYKWRDQFDPFDPSEESPPGNSRESALRKEINQLKRVLVDKTLELDFFKGALQKSRLDARRAASVARRRLRRNPRSDAFARQLKHRANVSAGGGQPSRFLSFSAGASTRRGRHGGTERDPADRHRAPTPIRVSTDQRRVAAARDAGQSQACVADHTGRQPAGRAAAGVRSDHGFRSRVRGLSESRQSHETDGNESAVGSGYHLYPFEEGVCLPGGGSGHVLSQGGGMGSGSHAGGPIADRSSEAGHRATTAAAGSGASFRPWCAVRVRRLHPDFATAPDDSQHEPTGEPL